ncbi:MAG: glycosyltransferase family 2 protein [Xanthomonadaceae bacterium]|nr:glycosyltransferase family 2 protein [Xanthomonadaceae bacterium]
MKVLFWIGLFGALYSYFLYPLLLMPLSRRRRRPLQPPAELPTISLIVTAHNEAARIKDKLENCLLLDYPRQRLEILVASDASSDGTDELVAGYAERGVRLIRAPERRGKEWAQLLAVQAARGEILVFSDVATTIPGDGLRRLAACFADPQVGAVSSEDRFVAPDGELLGEGLYVRYEMWLRRLESGAAGLVGLSGSFFAARREVCLDWDVLVPSDFNAALNCVRHGYIAVTEPTLLGFYPAIQDEDQEYQRKLRTVLRGITGLMRRLDVLNPLRYGLFSFQVFSHKLMRWLVPWFLLLLLVASARLAREHAIYALALAGQLAFYLLVLGGTLSERLRRLSWVKVPYFFVTANLAVAQAGIDFLRGKRVTAWQPSKR